MDNRVQSPVFSFADGSWILKLFLYGQTKFKTESKVDIVIERLQSDIRKHPLLYEIFVKSDDKNGSLLDDYLENTNMFNTDIRGFFIFDSDHTQENVIGLKSYTDFLSFAASKRQFGTIAITSGFRTPKKSEIRLNSQMASVQPIVGEYCLISFLFLNDV